MGLAVSQISRRRADQLGDLMRVLELGAIDLDTCPRVSKQRLRHRLDYPRLSRASRSQEEQVPHRTSRRVQARQEHLIDLYHLLDRLILPHNAPPQSSFKLSSIVASPVRIEHCCEIRSHKNVAGAPDFPFRPLFAALLWFCRTTQAPTFFLPCFLGVARFYSYRATSD